MPWKTLCGFPPNGETITLRVPNGLWRPDTVITDYEGTEMFVLLDQVQSMRSYEAIFGDLDGRRLVCIKRHMIAEFWRDGYYFCTYKPNYKGQRPLLERDVDNKKVYPFSYLQVSPMKGRFYYRIFDNQEGLSPPKMRSENPWLGFMVVCCTPMVRTGKWTASFQRKNQNIPTIYVDQWRNCVDIGPGNDVLASLCMAYVFDRYQCQPLVTIVGGEKEQYLLQPDDHSIASDEGKDIEEQQQNQQHEVEDSRYLDNTPDDQDQEQYQQHRGSYQSYGDDDNDDQDYDDFVNKNNNGDNNQYSTITNDIPSFYDQTTTSQSSSAYNSQQQPLTIYENDDEKSSVYENNTNNQYIDDDQSSGWYSTTTDDNSSALFSSSNTSSNTKIVPQQGSITKVHVSELSNSNNNMKNTNSSKMSTVNEYDDDLDDDDEPKIV